MQKRATKKFGASYFAAVLILGIILAFVILYFGNTSSSYIVQTVSLLVSMILVFYCSHPLAHYLVGAAYGIKTKYFFLGRSDFRKLGGTLGKLGELMPTIGTKFDLQVSGMGKGKRSFLFGAGAIVSSVAILVPLILSFVLRFNLIALVLGTLLFLGSLATELLFSTKSGDLYKMRRERSRL